MRHVASVVGTLLLTGAHVATKYVNDKEVVRATRRMYRTKLGTPYFSRKMAEVIVTIGRPNYAERKFIKLCKRADVAFPVRKVQLKYPARRRIARANRG